MLKKYEFSLLAIGENFPEGTIAFSTTGGGGESHSSSFYYPGRDNRGVKKTKVQMWGPSGKSGRETPLWGKVTTINIYDLQHEKIFCSMKNS